MELKKGVWLNVLAVLFLSAFLAYRPMRLRQTKAMKAFMLKASNASAAATTTHASKATCTMDAVRSPSAGRMSSKVDSPSVPASAPAPVWATGGTFDAGKWSHVTIRLLITQPPADQILAAPRAGARRNLDSALVATSPRRKLRACMTSASACRGAWRQSLTSEEREVQGRDVAGGSEKGGEWDAVRRQGR